MGKEAVELTQKLVNIRSYTGDEKQIAEYIAEYFEKNGIEVEIDQNYNVIATVGSKNQYPLLLLNGHMDTVPVDHNKWNVDPFSGIIHNDYLYGRGAADMKGALASMMVAMKYLKKDERSLEHRVIFTGVVCEEATEGHERERGIVSLIKAGYGAHFAIVGEATNLDISIGHRGRAVFRINVLGKSAHASMPKEGINALIYCSRLFIDYLDSKITQLFNQSDSDRALTLIPVQMEAGTAANVIPGSCTLTLESRFFGEKNLKEVQNFISQCIKKFKRKYKKVDSLNIDWEVIGLREPFLNQTEGKEGFAQVVQEVISKIRPCSFYFNKFYTDAGYIHSLLKIPTVIIGPGDEQMAHKPNECIPVEHLKLASRIYYTICRELPRRVKAQQIGLNIKAAR